MALSKINIDKKIILIVNKGDVLFLKPLSIFIDKNHSYISHIFTTSFLNNNSDSRKYIIASLRILKLSYSIKLLFKTILYKIISFLPISIKAKKSYSLKSLAKYHNIPISNIKDVNSKSFILELSKHKDAIVFSNTSQIYGKEILGLGIKFYNFHPSLLPSNKGRFPIFWAIVNGDKQGVTCHEIDERIDHGKIIKHWEIETEKNDRVEHIMQKILDFTPEFMEEALFIIGEGKMPQIKSRYKSFYGPIPDKKTIKLYKKIVKSNN